MSPGFPKMATHPHEDWGLPFNSSEETWSPQGGAPLRQPHWLFLAFRNGYGYSSILTSYWINFSILNLCRSVFFFFFLPLVSSGSVSSCSLEHYLWELFLDWVQVVFLQIGFVLTLRHVRAFSTQNHVCTTLHSETHSFNKYLLNTYFYHDTKCWKIQAR